MFSVYKNGKFLEMLFKLLSLCCKCVRRSTSPRKGQHAPMRANSNSRRDRDSVDELWEQTSLTYGQLRKLIEKVLRSTGYYPDIHPQVGDEAYA